MSFLVSKPWGWNKSVNLFVDYQVVTSVATARTLTKAEIDSSDEFLSELDDDNIAAVLDAVKAYIESSGAAMILVEHDINRAKQIPDRMLVIDDGRLNPFIDELTIQEVKF